MSECPHSAETHRLLDGESNDPDAARAHLLDCAECRAEFDAGVQLQLLAAAAKARRDAALRDEMRDEIADLQDQLRRAGDELKSQADHQGETIARYARDEVALKARVEEAERERDALREAGRGLVVSARGLAGVADAQKDAAEARAQRAEVLVRYATGYRFAGPGSAQAVSLGSIAEPEWFIERTAPGGWLEWLALDGEWVNSVKAERSRKRYAHPDLDSALRALKAARLLPDDVKVIE